MEENKTALPQKRNIRLDLQYDGTNYHGFQIQKNADTVQKRLKDAVHTVTGEDVVIYGCGRTDAGVHALCYVCHFKTDSALPAQTLLRALRAQLPRDIALQSVWDVEDSFHARFDVIEKTYEYRIDHGAVQNPFLLHYALWVSSPLSVEKMRQAAKTFLGTHDFMGFASSGFSVKTTVRTVHRLDIVEEGSLLRVRISADGFLYNMVRIIVGTLLDVGRGRIAPEEIGSILKSRDRKRAGATAKPHGLYLAEIVYPQQEGR